MSMDHSFSLSFRWKQCICPRNRWLFIRIWLNIGWCVCLSVFSISIHFSVNLSVNLILSKDLTLEKHQQWQKQIPFFLFSNDHSTDKNILLFISHAITYSSFSPSRLKQSKSFHLILFHFSPSPSLRISLKEFQCYIRIEFHKEEDDDLIFQ